MEWLRWLKVHHLDASHLQRHKVRNYSRLAATTIHRMFGALK